MSRVKLTRNGLTTSGPVGGTAYRRPPFFRTKKLALLGRTESIKFAPWDDPSWTLASHTSAREFSKREPDWYFDLHRPACFQQQNKAWNGQYYTWLKHLQVPIFMQENWPEIPLSVRYPIERILQEKRAYLTNHCAYMIALALTEGVKTIGLFGCEYGAGTEYGTQRGSLEYWLGRFEEAGGTVVLPVKHCTLLNFPSTLYGYESHDEHGKLAGDYKAVFKQTVAQVQPNTLTVLSLTGASDQTRPTLMPPPSGEAIAWERFDAMFPPQPAVQ